MLEIVLFLHGDSQRPEDQLGKHEYGQLHFFFFFSLQINDYTIPYKAQFKYPKMLLYPMSPQIIKILFFEPVHLLLLSIIVCA